MKSILLTLLLIVSLTLGAQGQSQSQSQNQGQVQSQPSSNLTLIDNHSISLRLLGLEYNYEQHIKNRFVMNYGVGFAPTVWSDIFGTEANVALFPFVNIEPRYYYSFNKRAQMGKNIHKNSGSYLSVVGRVILPAFYSSKDITPTMEYQLVPTWGMRRVAYSGIFYEFNAGCGFGYAHNSHSEEFVIALRLNFKFGYVF